MTHEHPPGRPPAHPSQIRDDDTARALRATLLATEHWSLIASRNLSWNESFSRAGMFLTVLTGAVVALALVAQATGFGSDFVTFALLLLPVVLFVGLATYHRINEINEEDLVWVRGMNRLRRAYLELDPGLEDFLVSGWTEDLPGVLKTYGSAATKASPLATLTHGLVITPTMILVIDGVIAAVLVGLVLGQLGASMQAAAIGAVVGFVLVFGAFAWHGARQAMRSWVSDASSEE
jgi:hypothetical protein